jgi:hypothetical protein
VAGEVSERVKREGGPRIRKEGTISERTSTRLCLFLPFPAYTDRKGEKKRTMMVMTMMIITEGEVQKQREMVGFRMIRRGTRRKQGSNNCDDKIDVEEVKMRNSE